MVKTVTLTAGTPQAVTFSEAYPFYWIDNKTSGEVFASVGGTPEPGKDGTYNIAAGSQLRISGGDFNGGIVLLGEGKVQVVASGIAACPFKSAPVSGGVKEVSGASSYTVDAVDYPIISLNLYGKSTQNGVPSPDNPVDIVSVGDSGSVDVTACGKNIFDYRLIPSKTDNGVTCTNNNDGTFTFSGSKTDISNPFASLKRYTHAESINILKAGKYTLSSNTPQSSGLYACVNLYYNDAWVYDAVNTTTGHTRTFTVTEDMIAYDDFIFELGFFSYWGKDVITGTYNLQLEAGETATEFEPYKGTAASITSSLPLCGIPVSEGGNYTGSTGQQWVCDELIYNADGSGKNVKRTAKIDSYNGEAIATPFISTTGSMTTGATVIYQLAEPQEIELTAAEMTALRQLQTYSGVTNIFNSGGANMDVKFCTNKMLSEYVAPITTGLQAQIDELKAAVLSLGGNV